MQNKNIKNNRILFVLRRGGRKRFIQNLIIFSNINTKNMSVPANQEEAYAANAFPSASLSTDAVTCGICLDPMLPSQDQYTIACGHTFHTACISKCARRTNHKCPYCRGTVAAGVSGLVTSGSSTARGSTSKHLHGSSVPRILPYVATHHTTPVPHDDTPVEIDVTEDHLPDFPAQMEVTAAAAAAPAVSTLLSVETLVEYTRIPACRKEPLNAIVRIVAPPAPTTSRNGLDLVAVVDVSGSMEGAKLDMLKKTLTRILSLLTERDRISIVPFSDQAMPMCGLRCLTSGARDLLSYKINRLQVVGGTNIGAGIEFASKIISERTERNPVASILVLTDGNDSARREYTASILPTNTTCTLNTFGYGDEHDATLCAHLAEIGHGVFSYVKDVSDLGPMVGAALGGLLSIAAQGIVLTVAPTKPATSVRIADLVTNFPYKIDPVTHAWNIAVQDIYFGEKRDILFTLKAGLCEEAPTAHTFATISVSALIAPEFTQQVTVVSPQAIITRTEDAAEWPTAQNPEVAIAALRMSTAEALRVAAVLRTNHQKEEAKRVLHAPLDMIRSSAVKESPIGKGLVKDLLAALEIVESENFEYGGGLAMLNSTSSSHSTQRSSCPQSAYTTASQEEYSQKF
jgi:uncharacterized protein YegL